MYRIAGDGLQFKYAVTRMGKIIAFPPGLAIFVNIIQEPPVEDKYINQVMECPLFQGLNRSETETIVASSTVRHLKQEESVFAEGAPADNAYLIMEGQMGVRSHILEGRDKNIPLSPIIARLEQGEVFGEFGLIDDQPRSAEVVALCNATVLVLERNALHSIAQEQPTVGYRIMRNLAQVLINRMRQTNKKLNAALEWGWRVSHFDQL